jgi:hypothetical protein
VCDNCEKGYGFNVSTCGGNARIAADRYVQLRSPKWLEEVMADIEKGWFEEGIEYEGLCGPEAVEAILRRHLGRVCGLL